jgi:hypothetical protein
LDTEWEDLNRGKDGRGKRGERLQDGMMMIFDGWMIYVKLTDRTCRIMFEYMIVRMMIWVSFSWLWNALFNV